MIMIYKESSHLTLALWPISENAEQSSVSLILTGRSSRVPEVTLEGA